VVFADARHQPRASHPVADRSADLAEAELDAHDIQLDQQCRQHVHRRHIEIRRRADVDDDRVGRLGSGRDEAHDLVLRDIGIDERQWHVRAKEQEPGDGLGGRVTARVGEDRRIARDPAQDRDVRPAGLVQDGEQ